MSTISDIQSKLKQFNTFAKSRNASESDYIQTWSTLFTTPLSLQSAKSFASYYRDMRSNSRRVKTSRKQRGGAAIQGAPLEYSMAPGLNIQAYGRFPTEAGTDPASIRDFDVYFRDSLTADCGVKDSSLNVPADMGSNKVGGGKSRRGRKAQRRTKKHGGHRGRKSRRFRQRGGNILESITARAPFVYNSTVSPNTLQHSSIAWTGQPELAPADPSAHTWNLRTNGMGGEVINPGLIAHVPNDVGRLANPAPWMSAN